MPNPELYLKLDGPAVPPEMIGSGGLRLFGVVGQYANALDSAALSIIGDLDIRVKATLDDWTPLVDLALVAKEQSAALRSYRLRVLTTGVLQFAWSVDGTALLFANSTVPTGLTDRATKWVRVTLDVDNGAAGYTVAFYTSDDGVMWTPLGAAVVGGAPTSIVDNTAILEIGSLFGGTVSNLLGTVHQVTIKSGIDGAVAFDADFTVQPAQTRTFAESSTNAATVTINGLSTGGQFANGALSLPGRIGYTASTPDAAPLDLTGDIDVVVRATAQWQNVSPPAQTLISKHTTTPQLGWAFYIDSSKFKFYYSVDGTTQTFISPAATHAIPSGTLIWVRFTRIAATGAYAFYYSLDATSNPAAVTWTTYTALTGTAGTFFNNSATLNVGQTANGSGPFLGLIYRAIVKSSIDGTVVFDADFANKPIGTANFVESSANAAVVSVNGPLVADYSGNYRDAALFNGPVLGAAGKIGRCLTLDGVNDYGRVNAWAYSANFTWMAWVKVTAITATQQLILSTSAGVDGCYMRVDATTGKFSFIGWAASVGAVLTSASNIPVGTWAHIAIAYSAGVASLYLNGVLDAGPTARAVGVSALDLFVGASASPGSFFGGQLDDVRVYNSALSPIEIKGAMVPFSGRQSMNLMIGLGL